jgi:hypothetical protein
MAPQKKGHRYQGQKNGQNLTVLALGYLIKQIARSQVLHLYVTRCAYGTVEPLGLFCTRWDERQILKSLPPSESLSHRATSVR